MDSLLEPTKDLDHPELHSHSGKKYKEAIKKVKEVIRSITSPGQGV